MFGAVIGLIFTLILLGVIWWAIQQLLALLPIGEPFKTIIYVLSVVLLVCIVLWVASVLLGMVGVHVPTFR